MSTSKPIQAPAVVHSNSDKGQGEFFRDQAEKWRRSNSYVGGKGSRPRTYSNSKAWRDGWDEIFGKKSK